MSTVPRPLLANLLVAIVAIGHAPAWLHVAATPHEKTPHATAHQGIPGVHAREQTSVVSRSSCCCAHSQSTDVADGTGNPVDDGSGRSDHDHCVLCQSLFGTVGFVDAGNDDLCVEPLVTRLVCLDRGMIVSPLRSWVQPRGPPAASL